MALILVALWRYLTNSVTQTQKYILSKLHMGGIFFFFSQKLSLILFQKRKHYRNLVSKVPQKKERKKKEKGIQKSLWKVEEIQI